MNFKTKLALIYICTACLIMAYVDGFLKPDYAYKSFIKIVFFLLIPAIMNKFLHIFEFKNFFDYKNMNIKLPLILGSLIYVLIILGYFLVKDYFDFSSVTKTLETTINVTKKNFIYVSLYISFVNSFLEEFFFRGIAFISLKNISRKFAYLFSSIVFSLYHVAIIDGWFNVIIFIIIFVALLIGGLVFNYLNDKKENIYSSYLVHMFSNFAINTVGFILWE